MWYDFLTNGGADTILTVVAVAVPGVGAPVILAAKKIIFWFKVAAQAVETFEELEQPNVDILHAATRKPELYQVLTGGHKKITGLS